MPFWDAAVCRLAGSAVLDCLLLYDRDLDETFDLEYYGKLPSGLRMG